MTTRWRDATSTPELIAKTWLDGQDRQALEKVAELMIDGKYEQIDAIMTVLEDEGQPEAFDEMAQAMSIIAESSGEGSLLTFPFESNKCPDVATLRLSLKDAFDGMTFVLHPKPLDPDSLLEMPPYLLYSALSSLLGKKMTTSLPWKTHDGNGLSVFVGALKGQISDVAAPLHAWLQEKGNAMGCGLPTSPSGLPKVLDGMEDRRKARVQAEAELVDFLMVASEETRSPVTLRMFVENNTRWAEAVNEQGLVVDRRAFANLPIGDAALILANDDHATGPGASTGGGRRSNARASLRLIREDGV